ncbi:uncharacterized protein BDR25DRAFT_182223, partial [Lindgomyces ingoldianus]
QQERELEYKHRHTFIGTASLDDFLELLEMSKDYTTTDKARVSKAFTILAANEQIQARQGSSKGEGWEMVFRITPNLAERCTDYLTQAQIKLGALSLRNFLNLIPFDEKEITPAMSVVEAFCAASHLDAQAGGNGSKAKSFRSWVVR